MPIPYNFSLKSSHEYFANSNHSSFSGKAVLPPKKGKGRAQPKSHPRSAQSSPLGFEGFCDEDCDKKFFVPMLDSEFVLGDIFSSCEILRPRQPRTSKSKASLVWQKIKIKEEPEDDDVKILTKKSPEKAKPQENKAVENKKSKLTKQPTENPQTLKKTPAKNLKQAKTIPVKKKLVNRTAPKRSITKIALSKSALLKKIWKPEKLVENGQEPTDTAPKKRTTKSKSALLKKTFKPAENGEEASTSIPTAPSAVAKLNMMKRRRKRPNTKGFKCDRCGKVYKYLRGMRQHKKLECNVEPQFPCPYCPSQFRYRQNIREHVRNYHELAFPKWFMEHYIKPTLEREKLRRINLQDAD